MSLSAIGIANRQLFKLVENRNTIYKLVHTFYTVSLYKISPKVSHCTWEEILRIKISA